MNQEFTEITSSISAKSKLSSYCFKRSILKVLCIITFAVLLILCVLQIANKSYNSALGKEASLNAPQCFGDCPCDNRRPQLKVNGRLNFDETVPQDLKVAFIADVRLGGDGEELYKLIKQENAEMAIIAGDLDYTDNPVAWSDQIDRILGEQYPIFATVGMSLSTSSTN